jgi:hypothetical protein
MTVFRVLFTMVKKEKSTLKGKLVYMYNFFLLKMTESKYNKILTAVNVLGGSLGVHFAVLCAFCNFTFFPDCGQRWWCRTIMAGMGK